MKPQRSNIPSLVCVFAASATTGGALYAFGMYAEALKMTLHLSQSQLNTISAAMFIAGLFSWIPGIIVDRFGTKFSFCLGGLLGTLSTLAYWLVARQLVAVTSVISVLSLLGMITCLSCALIVGSVFKIILVSCGPGSKGIAVGIAKAYVGLGAGVYTCVFQAIRSHDETPLDFLPMSSFFFFALAFVPGMLILPNQQQVAQETIVDDVSPLHFRTLYVSLLLISLVVIGSSVTDLLDEANEIDDMGVIDQQTLADHKYGRASFILLIWLGPFASLLVTSKRGKALASKSLLRHGTNGRLAEKERPNGNDPIANAIFMASPLASSDNMLKAFCSSSELRRELSFIAASSSESITSMLGTPRQSFHGKSTLPTKPAGSLPSVLSNPPWFALEHRISEEDLEAQEDTFLLAGIGDDHHEEYTEIPPPPPSLPPASLTLAKDNHSISSSIHEYTLIELLQTPMSWLMLWTCTIVVGSGTLQVNNMGEMVASREFPEEVAPACLALFSVAQAMARVVTGAVSEACLARHGIPRPFFLVVASAIACLAHVILSFGNVLSVFVVGSVLSGIAFGMVWPLMVLIIGEVFGLDNHGANYMFYDGFTLAVGTLALSKFLAGALYDANLRQDEHANDSYTCYGPNCFRTTHLVVAALSLTCVISGIALEFGTRRAYDHQAQQYGR